MLEKERVLSYDMWSQEPHTFPLSASSKCLLHVLPGATEMTQWVLPRKLSPECPVSELPASPETPGPSVPGPALGLHLGTCILYTSSCDCDQRQH